jgi:3-oxoacyl-[acyl-carrier protein] reductase
MPDPVPTIPIPESHAHASLRDRVVLITGGGRGLGREMALALVQAGSKVAITAAREAAQLDDVVAAAGAAPGGGELIAIQADVTSDDDCRRAVAATIEAFGAIHALVNNAGRGLSYLSEDFVNNPVMFWEADSDAWRMIIETNVIGQFQMAKAAAPHMIEQGFGRIVNVSTSDVTMVRRGYSPYGPSKAALEACSVVWSRDLADTGVTVNVLLPGGATDTAFIPGGGTGRTGADGKLLRPEIMGPPMLWLASDLSNGWTCGRYIARLWDGALPPDEAAAAARQPQHEKPAII